jgi:hypothetical protein
MKKNHVTIIKSHILLFMILLSVTMEGQNFAKRPKIEILTS